MRDLGNVKGNSEQQEFEAGEWEMRVGIDTLKNKVRKATHVTGLPDHEPPLKQLEQISKQELC